MDTMVCTSLNYRQYEYNPDCGSEGFIVEDLLDFSNDDIGAPIDEENTSEETSPSASVDGNYSPENENNQTANQDPPEELCVPMDSLEDLEWLSNFVEDSFSVGGLGEFPPCYLLPSVDGKKDHYQSNDDDESKAKQQTQQKQNSNNNVVFSACKDLGTQWIPVRARRSKRCRAGGRVWTFCPLLPSHQGFESQASLFTTSDSSSNSCVTYSRPPKKHKTHHNHNINSSAKKHQDAIGGPARRCSHCHVQKTPQWRAGPLGPKTLCNACGVRFKSGRLLPEYRPAVSPTFLSDVHSNSHRKVLELRRQKEQEEQNQIFTTVQQEQEEPKQEVFLA